MRRRVGAAELPLGEIGEGQAAGPGRGGREAAADDRLGELEGLELDATDVRGGGADAHPGECLSEPCLERVEQTADRVRGRQLLCAARSGELDGQLDGEARMDGAGTGGDGHRGRVDVEDVRRIEDEVGPTAEAGCGQGRVDSADRQHGRDRRTIEAHASIRDHEQPDTSPSQAKGLGRQALERGLESARTLRARPCGVEALRPHRDRAEQPLEVGHEWALEALAACVDRCPRTSEHRWPRPQIDAAVDDGPLPIGIDGRVGDLGEGLAEVVGDRSVGPRPGRRGRVVAHAPERFVALDDHRPEVESEALSIEAGEEPEAGFGHGSAGSSRGRGRQAIHERLDRPRP